MVSYNTSNCPVIDHRWTDIGTSTLFGLRQDIRVIPYRKRLNWMRTDRRRMYLPLRISYNYHCPSYLPIRRTSHFSYTHDIAKLHFLRWD